MTREEFYKLTDILNSEVLGNFMHGGEADELIAMFEEAVEHSNILEQEKPVSEDLEEEIEEYWKNAPTGTVYFPMWEHFQIIAHHFAEWGKKQAEIEIQAQSMALAHGCPKEPVSEELEDAANKWDAKASFTPFYMVLDDNGNPNGVRQDYTTHTESFKAGAKWQIAKLMANATSVTVHKDAGGYPYIPPMELYDYDKDIPLAKEGDKYKVVLVKEE